MVNPAAAVAEGVASVRKAIGETVEDAILQVAQGIEARRQSPGEIEKAEPQPEAAEASEDLAITRQQDGPANLRL